MSARELIAERLDLWTGAVTKKSSSGRGSNSKIELTGIRKLRQLILRLAVIGQLVEQDDDDEPTKRLINRIYSEDGNGRSRLSHLHRDEKTTNLPIGWDLAFLPEVTEDKKYAIKRGPFGSALKKAFFKPSGFKVYEQQHAINDDFARGNYYINEEKFTELKAFEVSPGDLIISCSGTVGCVAEAPSWMEPGIINQALLKLSLDQRLLTNDYFKILFSAFFLQTETLKNLQGTAQKNMVSMETLKKEPFPMPPIEEQHRIVQKVDELMALCDRLEQQSGDQLEAHETLVDTLLGTLTQSENVTELADNWACVAAHFDTLFTTEQSIDKLKQTILQMAVMGRLVEQSPFEGNASALLQEIADEKKRLVETGVLKRKKNNVAQNESELFAIPSTWSWVISNEVCTLITDGEHNTPERTTDDTAVPLATAKNVRDGYIDLTNTDFVPRGVAETCWNRCKPELGDILMVSVGATLGRLAIMRDSQDMVLVRSVTLMRPMKVLGEYLAIYLQAPTTQSWIWRNVRQSAQPCLYLSKSSSIPVSVPPLAEQHRIVQKVDELMALCDQLKERLSKAAETRNQLAEAVVEGALN